MSFDDLARTNRERWNGLVAADVQYARPWLDLDQETARQRVDPVGLLGDLRGRRVLCLAGGGGQQSAAFALLGAEVTVFDLSDAMLDRDRQAAAHYGHSVRLIQGDARDLGPLESDSFDAIWQAHCLTFIPQLDPLLDGVSRVLAPAGIYHLSCWNPLAYGAEEHWTGQGYLLRDPYVEGAEARIGDGFWDIDTADGRHVRAEGPREFRHTLTAIFRGLLSRGFVLLDVYEEPAGDPTAPGGSWAHFCSIAPPWLCLWSALRADVRAQCCPSGLPARPAGPTPA